MLPIWGGRPARRGPAAGGPEAAEPAAGSPEQVAEAAQRVEGPTAPPPVELPLAGEPASNGAVSTPESESVGDRISLGDVERLQARGAPVVLLDVRTERTHQRDAAQAKGAVRLPPDHVVERATELGLDHEAWLVAYCA